MLYSYATVQLWINAVKNAESLDFSEVTSQLNQHEFTTALGPVQFNGKGDWQSPSFVPFMWMNGKATNY